MNKTETIRNFIWSAIVLLFSSCSFEPSYDPPDMAVSEQWKNTPKNTDLFAEVGGWWEIFQDPKLNSLIQQAVANNPSLMAAGERVEQARDIAKIVKSRLFPQINFTPGYRNTEFLNKYPFGPNSNKPFTTKSRVWEYEYSLPLSLSFEVDLWGKIRSEYKSAKLSMEAQKEAFQAVLLVLTAEVAGAYFQLRVQDAQIELLRAIIDTRKNAREIHQARYEGEVVDYTPVTLIEQDLDNVESQYFSALEIRALFENQIAVLLGVTPSEFTIESIPLLLTNLPPVVPSGIPSEMLLRRPDLIEQERLMASYHAQIGVAYASYFPSLILTGGLGFRSPDWSNFLKDKSKYWLAAADVSQFIFDAGRRSYNVQLSWSQFRESADLYKQKVLIAFQEVEDALSNLEWIGKGMDSLADSVEAAKTNFVIASDRYKLGVINYLDVTNNRRQVLDNQRAYLMLLGQAYGNTIQLIKALGGGWDETGRKLEVSH